MVDFARLAQQGRAYSSARPWETHELDAVILIEKERHLTRVAAADYVRNGIMTLEAFDKATKAEFKPKTLEEAEKEVESALKDNAFAKTKTRGRPKGKK